MDSGMIGDLKMDGIGTAAGGVYKKVALNGVCKVATDIEAQLFDADGRIRVGGHLAASELDLDGTLDVAGGVRAGAAAIDGVITVKGAYAGQRLRLNGMLAVGGDCEMDALEGEGAFKIGGLLNAGTIDLKLQGRGTAKEIGGESIRIGKGRTGAWQSLWQRMLPSFAQELVADTIEGDWIELDHATVKVVRGDRVTIGEGCVIDRVEYRTELRKHPSARIGEEAKVNG
ncbi:bactofilin [Cohnella hashimotonis]|uniref:Bactofilin n=1 Tax=Cohnella hashimotonis TaxID=2826895 RepID=A0ABT6TL99_9BACL|nr:bactofilin [Cohnella hashimotonis]MDI4647510.1 bactofilin [Cohnella hashimotonis]